MDSRISKVDVAAVIVNISFTNAVEIAWELNEESSNSKVVVRELSAVKKSILRKFDDFSITRKDSGVY